MESTCNNDKIPMWIGIYSTNTPEETVVYLQSLFKPTADSFAHIEAPCGQSVVYQTAADFPHTSVACPCGDPAHWILKYDHPQEALV